MKRNNLRDRDCVLFLLRKPNPCPSLIFHRIGIPDTSVALLPQDLPNSTRRPLRCASGILGRGNMPVIQAPSNLSPTNTVVVVPIEDLKNGSSLICVNIDFGV